MAQQYLESTEKTVLDNARIFQKEQYKKQLRYFLLYSKSSYPKFNSHILSYSFSCGDKGIIIGYLILGTPYIKRAKTKTMIKENIRCNVARPKPKRRIKNVLRRETDRWYLAL